MIKKIPVEVDRPAPKDLQEDGRADAADLDLQEAGRADDLDLQEDGRDYAPAEEDPADRAEMDRAWYNSVSSAAFLL